MTAAKTHLPHERSHILTHFMSARTHNGPQNLQDFYVLLVRIALPQAVFTNRELLQAPGSPTTLDRIKRQLEGHATMASGGTSNASAPYKTPTTRKTDPNDSEDGNTCINPKDHRKSTDTPFSASFCLNARKRRRPPTRISAQRRSTTDSVIS